MSGYKHYKVLDNILECFNTEEYINGDRHYLKESEIGDKIYEKNKETFDAKRIIEGLEYLHSKGYLKEKVIENENKSKTWMYALSFEGYLLIKDNGYVDMITIHKRQIRFSKRVERLVSIATILAGIYATVQILDTISSLYSHILDVVHHP